MTEMFKDVAWPRRVWPPGHDQPVDLEPLIPALEKRVHEMLAEDIPIPLVWKHDDTAVPGKEAALKLSQGDGRLKCGDVTGARIDTDGTLLSNLSVEDAEDVKQIKKVKYCSPWIKWDWRDGNGRVWKGPSILHVAVTARPVVTPQRPFQLSHDGHPVELFLAMSDYEREGPMPDDPKPAEKPAKEEKPKKESKDKGSDLGAMNDEDKMKEVLKYMADMECPIILPSDTDLKNVWDRLGTAILTLNGHKKSKSKDEPPGAPTAPSGAGDKPVEVPEPNNPVGLSHDQLQQLKRADRAEQFAIKAGREKLLARVHKLRGNMNIGKPVLDKLEADLKEVKLSLGDDGEPARNELVAKIEALEGVELADETRRRAVEVSDPEDAANERKLNGSVMNKLSGGRYKAPA